MNVDIRGMPGSTREIRRRVRAVKNIRQITRAMELVSAAKMQRSVEAVQQSRRYAVLSWEMLRAVTAKISSAASPLLVARPRQRLLLILITSNRGLAGGFNGRVCEAAKNYLYEQKTNFPDIGIETVSVGRKGREYLLKFGWPVVADFVISDRANTADEVLPLASLVMKDYEVAKYDAVAVVYTDFVSMLKQEPVVKEILPVSEKTSVSPHTLASDDMAEGSGVVETGAYLFEPNPGVVLDSLVPRLIAMQLYQAVVGWRASEHAARMVAMRNATESAGDLITDLTLAYNQLRQSGITQELSEISAGRLALGV